AKSRRKSPKLSAAPTRCKEETERNVPSRKIFFDLSGRHRLCCVRRRRVRRGFDFVRKQAAGSEGRARHFGDEHRGLENAGRGCSEGFSDRRVAGSGAKGRDSRRGAEMQSGDATG